MRDSLKLRKILLSLLGVTATAVSVGVCKFAAFGVDPFQTFMSGMHAVVPLSFGTVYVLVNAVLLLFALIFDRHYIGIATVINLVLLGYIADFSLSCLQTLIPAPGMGGRCLAFVLGFLLLCLGSSLYMTADLGVSTYDAIALVACHKWKLGKFRVIRIVTDLICVLSGVGLYLCSGGSTGEIAGFVGAGTVITAFCMGPLIDFFNKTIAQPLLK